MAILPFKLPYCQITTEKGQMEEQYWRSQIFSNHFDYLCKNGYECDETNKLEIQKEQQELLMKMFALSCRLEREFRCTELAEFMTHNVMSLAIKYASRSKRLTLAQRLSELALEKAAELASAQEGEGEEDQRGGLNAGSSRSAAEWGESRGRRAEEEEDVEKNGEEEEGEEPEEEEEAAPVPPRLGRAGPCLAL
ncbi:WD repeat and HMG-box DNA-binding protein 1-like [Mantella aurantiaca]